jgi:hypothetical protein
MATTTYRIFKATTEGETLVATKSKKSVAVELATQIRRDEKVGTRVETSAGTVVFEAKARKPQKKTKPYTRVVALPEGVEVPEGKRVAYTRTRKNAAILHDAEEQLYTVIRYSTGEQLGTFDTTRQCGRFLADEVSAEGELVNA